MFSHDLVLLDLASDVPSFGSATARETFFSSLIESSRDASLGVTLPSTRAATSSKAVAALSNFWNCLSFNLGEIQQEFQI